MPMDVTAAGLVASVRRRASLPTTGGHSDADILATINEEMQDYIVALLMSTAAEHFVAPHDTTTTAGTAGYDIPSDSIGSKVRDVQVSTDGGANYISLPYVEPERVANSTNRGTPGAYYLQNNSVILVPCPSGAFSLRIKYYRRPGYIVSAGYSAPTAVTGSGPYAVTVGSTSGMAAGTFDLRSSSGNYGLLLEGVTGTVTDGTTLSLTLTAAQLATLQAALGTSWLVASGDSPVALVPQECVPLLEQRTAAMVLQQLADPRMQQAFVECERAEARVLKMLAPREAGRGRKVVGRSGPGWTNRWPAGWPNTN